MIIDIDTERKDKCNKIEKNETKPEDLKSNISNSYYKFRTNQIHARPLLF